MTWHKLLNLLRPLGDQRSGEKSCGDEIDVENIRRGFYADRYPFARDVVRVVGEEVAVVAASTLALSQAAAHAIEVEYELIDPVASPATAIAEGAPVVHQRENLPANIAQITEADWGGVSESLAKSAHVVEGVYSNPVVVPVCMETNGVVASFNVDERTIDVWAGTQVPFFARKELTHIAATNAWRLYRG